MNWFNIIKNEGYDEMHHRRFTTTFYPNMVDAGLKHYADELLRYSEETIKEEGKHTFNTPGIYINLSNFAHIANFVLARHGEGGNKASEVHNINVNMVSGIVKHSTSNTHLKEISVQELRQIIDGLLGEE